MGLRIPDRLTSPITLLVALVSHRPSDRHLEDWRYCTVVPSIGYSGKFPLAPAAPTSRLRRLVECVVDVICIGRFGSRGAFTMLPRSLTFLEVPLTESGRFLGLWGQ
jgi:hypothetical protein